MHREGAVNVSFWSPLLSLPHSRLSIFIVVCTTKDTLNLMRTGHGDRNVGNAGSADLGALDASLRSLLQGWFSVGFLELRRITYEDSGGALLEKITR